MDPTVMHLDLYDAEKQFGGLDEMSDEHKINEAMQMNRELGKLERKANNPAVYAAHLQKIRGITRNCRENWERTSIQRVVQDRHCWVFPI